jgi:hypothetical protein
LRLQGLSGQKTVRMRLRPLDIAAAILAAAAVALTSIAVYGNASGRLRAVISDGKDEWLYPLDASRDVEVPGPLGTTVVEIKDGNARVLDSPCPNKTCIAAGEISLNGQWLACLPNRVFVRIEGGPSDGDTVDAGVY